MSWSAKAALTGLGVALSEVSNSDADFLAADHGTQWVTMNPGESAVVQLEVAFGSTGNDVQYRVVGTLDDTAEAADNVAFRGGIIPFTASATVRRSLVVSDLYKWRLEVRKGGTTAGSYTPVAYIRKDGISI